MGEHPDKDLVFVTISMAEILLAQNLIVETETVVRQLKKSDPDNPRVLALVERLDELRARGPIDEQTQGPVLDEDRAALELAANALRLSFELTQEGLEVARKRAKYSGRGIARLFTAAPGPRGVRTATRDIDLQHEAGTVALHGLPHPAVHVAAVGFLANTGVFVPLARSAPCVVTR